MQFKRRLSPNASVDLIPMIDVVFQLVVFFMLSSTFLQSPGISILFPESSSAEPVVMTRLVVTILSPEEIYLNRDEYGLSSFEEAVKDITEEDREEIRSVVIEADRSVQYDLLVHVMDVLRLEGFKAINLRTREEPES